jgi:hypothetical protein
MSNGVAGVCFCGVDAGGSQKESGNCAVHVHDDGYLYVWLTVQEELKQWKCESGLSQLCFKSRAPVKL